MRSVTFSPTNEFTVPVFPPTATPAGYALSMLARSAATPATPYSCPTARLYQLAGICSWAGV